MTEQASTATDGRVAFLHPDGLPHNPAFSNVAVVSGSVRTIDIGGQDAVDAQGNIVGIGDLAAQTEQVLRNLRTALAAAGAGLEHVVTWNVLVVDGQDFGPGSAAFQRVWGDRPNPPVITAAVVKGLAHPDFLVEMDGDRGRSCLTGDSGELEPVSTVGSGGGERRERTHDP
jgi:enamine deaminase RidA (YjgF/YER057c/UK114 family)